MKYCAPLPIVDEVWTPKDHDTVDRRDDEGKKEGANP